MTGKIDRDSASLGIYTRSLYTRFQPACLKTEGGGRGNWTYRRSDRRRKICCLWKKRWLIWLGIGAFWCVYQTDGLNVCSRDQTTDGSILRSNSQPSTVPLSYSNPKQNFIQLLCKNLNLPKLWQSLTVSSIEIFFLRLTFPLKEADPTWFQIWHNHCHGKEVRKERGWPDWGSNLTTNNAWKLQSISTSTDIYFLSIKFLKFERAGRIFICKSVRWIKIT